MVKKYIFFTPTIFSAAGSQIYTISKKDYLAENGWDVDVISFISKGTIMIDKFKNYKNSIIPELSIPPHLFPTKRRNEIIDKIVKIIGYKSYQKLVIESHTKNLSLWGEIVAEECNCKHLVFLLMEKFGKTKKNVLDYLNFKHNRRELAGINEKSLELLFYNYKTIDNAEKYTLRASMQNIVENIECPKLRNIKKKDINIGSIGRFDKEYFLKMIEEIIIFTKSNPEKQIQLILIGDSKDGEVEKIIINKTKNIKNLKLVITGRLFPIPKSLFNLVDIFIGVAGSARVSALEGVPTIVIDVNDFKSIGILGYETKKALYGESKKRIPISEKIKEVLERYDFYKSIKLKDLNKNIYFDAKEEYKKQIDFIFDSCNSKEYFNVISKESTALDKIMRMTLLVLGSRLFLFLINNKVIKKIWIKFNNMFVQNDLFNSLN